MKRNEKNVLVDNKTDYCYESTLYSSLFTKYIIKIHKTVSVISSCQLMENFNIF